MSYHIEYQWAVFHIPAQSFDLDADRFVVAIEGGDNNCYTHSGKRARSWNVCMIGTKEQVLKRAVYHAGACESGCLQPRGRCYTPEAYIRRIRRLIDGPTYTQNGWWTPELRIAVDHPLVADLRQIGIEPTFEKRFGEMTTAVSLPQEAYPDFFRLVDKYGNVLPPWSLASVSGLPHS
jgi:hypothetical protein